MVSVGPFPGARAVIVCGDSGVYVWGFILPDDVVFFARLAVHPVLGGFITLLFLPGALI